MTQTERELWDASSYGRESSAWPLGHQDQRGGGRRQGALEHLARVDRREVVVAASCLLT